MVGMLVLGMMKWQCCCSLHSSKLRCPWKIHHFDGIYQERSGFSTATFVYWSVATITASLKLYHEWIFLFIIIRGLTFINHSSTVHYSFVSLHQSSMHLYPSSINHPSITHQSSINNQYFFPQSISIDHSSITHRSSINQQ